MGDLGLSSTFGVGAMQQSVRQRILDQLAREAQGHQQSIEDQRLELERQRVANESSNQALLRQQQATAFNEGVGEKAGANLGPGQSVLTPSQAAPILAAPSMRGLIQPDQTLPSTSMSAGVPLAPQRPSSMQGTTEITPGTQVAGTAPTITQQGPQLTGQLRFMGTPAANAAEAQKVRASQFVSGLPAGSVERRTAEYEQAFPGRNPPNFDKTTADPLEQVAGPNGPVFVPRSQAAGKTPYHQPPAPQLAIVQTQNEQGQNVTKIVPKVAGAEFAGKQDAQAIGQTRAKTEALDTLGQLDQAIDAAAPMIGPGAGRVSNIEQMIGNADPKIQALGVKMKAAKMQADHAISGSMRAGASPTLIKLWDNILANNITPEGLKAGVQALREVIQGSGGGGATHAGAVRKYNPATGKLD